MRGKKKKYERCEVTTSKNVLALFETLTVVHGGDTFCVPLRDITVEQICTEKRYKSTRTEERCTV